MVSKGIQIVYGSAFMKRETIEETFSTLEAGGVKVIDTATVYGESEEILGSAGVGGRFIVDTKTKGGIGGEDGASEENVVADAENSKALLKSDVDVFYIHCPGHPGRSMEETLQGVKKVFDRGFFKRFGLSNYFAEDVEKMYNLCKKMGIPTPSVYQGNYNPVARKQEELLFPTLRKLGMSFYAYSPLAGGFLTKTKQDILDKKGRFDPDDFIGKMYSDMYNRPSYLEALAKWEAIAKEEGVSRASLAYRWVRFNSPLSAEHGDALIVGASSTAQLKETLERLNDGPLSGKAVKAIDEVWQTIKHEAPLDNLNH